MLTQKQIKEKLFKLPEKFLEEYERGHFAQAKAAYDDAIQISTFVELEEAEQIKLFGGRAFGEEGTGLFDEKKVQKAYQIAIRKPR